MKTALFLLAAAILHVPASAQSAYEQSYSGHLEWHNQVEYHTIQIYQGAGHLRIWTDSYANGASFDPVLTLWHNGVKVALNDDRNTFSYYQSIRDAGIELYGLADGTYVATLSTYPNFPLGNTIGAGFTYDSQAPIPMGSWCAPGNPGPECRMGRLFSLHWTVQ